MNPAVKILYLEDDPMDIKLVRETLVSEGFAMEMASVATLEDFTRALTDGQFDLVLADYRLPGFTGRDALRVSLHARPEVPFIFVSGALGEEQAIELLKEGATDYVLKDRLRRLAPALRRAVEEGNESKRRREADRDLRESNVRLAQVLESVTGLLERLFENSHVLIVHLDAGFDILRVNRAYARVHEQSMDHFVGKNYFALYPNDDTKAIFRRVLETGVPYAARASPASRICQPEGREAFWDWSIEPVQNESKEVEGLILCLLDVTGRKRARIARMLSERRYRELVESVDSIIMRWKPDGSITFANRFAREFLGYSMEEFLHGDADRSLFVGIDRSGAPLPPPILAAVESPGQSAVYECENARRDGSLVWVRWTCRAIRDANRNVVEILCVGGDITDRKRKEEEMQRTQQQLREFARMAGTTLQGRALSPGLAEGVAVLYLSPEFEPIGAMPIEAGDIETEMGRFDRAVERSIEELESVRDQVVSRLADKETAIVDAHIAMLKDATFADKCKQRVRDDLIKVEHAVAAEVRDLEALLQGMKQEHMHERSADVRDIGRRVLWNLREDADTPRDRLKLLPPGTVLVADQLLPSDTLQLDRDNVVAFVTERDGPASHMAILARALGIPAVCDIRDVTSVLANGDRLLVDADAGTVTVAPTRRQALHFAARKVRQTATPALTKGQSIQKCATSDGIEIALHANIARSDEAHLVRELRMDGVGLFRSEFLFLDADRPSDIEEQCATYTTVARAVDPRPVVIRTVDLGGDKMPRFAEPKSDLALRAGKRGLAYSLTEGSLFRIQIRAILRAAKLGNVRIMFPMVLGVADMRAAREIVEELIAEERPSPRLPIGAMIETPSAVFGIREILDIADFVSIGTNDLAQYTLGMDRTLPDPTSAPPFMHPSVLRATDLVVRAAVEREADLAVCGEAAGEPGTACLLIGMGVRKLSMSPFLAARVRRVIRLLTIGQVETAAREALAANTAKEVQEIVAAMLRGVEMEASALQ